MIKINKYFGKFSLMSPRVKAGGQLLFIVKAKIRKFINILHTNDKEEKREREGEETIQKKKLTRDFSYLNT